MERQEDDERAQNAEGAEAPSGKNVLTPVLQVPSATAEAIGEGRGGGEVLLVASSYPVRAVLLAVAVDERQGPGAPAEERAQSAEPQSAEKSPPRGVGTSQTSPTSPGTGVEEEPAVLEEEEAETESALVALDELAARVTETEPAADEPVAEGGGELYPWLPSPGGNPTRLRLLHAQRLWTRFLETLAPFPEARRAELEQQKLSDMILDNAEHDARKQAIALHQVDGDHLGSKHQWRELAKCDVAKNLKATCEFKEGQMARQIVADAGKGVAAPQYTFPKYLAPLGRSKCHLLRPPVYGRTVSDADAALMTRHLQYARSEQGVFQKSGVLNSGVPKNSPFSGWKLACVEVGNVAPPPYFETPAPNISPKLIFFLVVSHLKVPTLGRQHQKCTHVVRKWGEGTDLTGKVSLTLPIRSVDPHLRICPELVLSTVRNIREYCPFDREKYSRIRNILSDLIRLILVSIQILALVR
jgi:hypothetical protein